MLILCGILTNGQAKDKFLCDFSGYSSKISKRKFSEVVDQLELNSNELTWEIEQQGRIIYDLLEDTSRLIDMSIDKTIPPQDKMVSYKKFVHGVMSAGEKINQVGLH